MSLIRQPTAYCVQVMRNRKRVSKRFAFSKYGGEAKARKAAVKFRREVIANLGARVWTRETNRKRVGCCSICSWILADPSSDVCGPADGTVCFKRRAGVAA